MSSCLDQFGDTPLFLLLPTSGVADAGDGSSSLPLRVRLESPIVSRHIQISITQRASSIGRGGSVISLRYAGALSLNHVLT